MDQAKLARENEGKTTSAFRDYYHKEVQKFNKQPLKLAGAEEAKKRSICGSVFDCNRTCETSGVGCSTGDWGNKTN